ncbi:MAG: HemK/PrmC family methyltransferase [Patescibacteria group bacterium]|nr:HemK/PrmC family methyltransferase [Patescibacteria group bacterium]
MNLKQALDFATRILRLHTCEGSDAEREAEELLAFSTGIGRSDILSDQTRVLSDREEVRLAEILSRRLEHEPMARIFGTAHFLGRDFVLDRNVLIPRPTTEIIVGQAIEACGRLDKPTVIDVGTGSGCIAISMALALPNSQIIAIDVSRQALEAAGRNALAHRVADRIEFTLGDLLSGLQPPASSLSLVIIANLPYIPTDQMYYLSPCVTIGDPLLALDGGPDGLALYTKLLDQIAGLDTKQEILLYFELLPGQITTMKQEIKKRFPEAEISEIKASEDAEVIGLEVHKS